MKPGSSRRREAVDVEDGVHAIVVRAHDNHDDDNKNDELCGRRVGAHTNRERHFRGTTAGQQLGFEHNVSCNLHGVLQVALHLVQEVLAASAQQNRARLGFSALLKEGEVPVQQHKQTTAHTH